MNWSFQRLVFTEVVNLCVRCTTSSSPSLPHAEHSLLCNIEDHHVREARQVHSFPPAHNVFHTEEHSVKGCPTCTLKKHRPDADRAPRSEIISLREKDVFLPTLFFFCTLNSPWNQFSLICLSGQFTFCTWRKTEDRLLFSTTQCFGSQSLQGKTDFRSTTSFSVDYISVHFSLQSGKNGRKGQGWEQECVRLRAGKETLESQWRVMCMNC